MEKIRLTTENLPKSDRDAIETEFCFRGYDFFKSNPEYQNTNFEYWKQFYTPYFEKFRKMKINKIQLSIAEICKYAHGCLDSHDWIENTEHRPYLDLTGSKFKNGHWIAVFFNSDDLDNGNILNFNHMVAYRFFDANKQFYFKYGNYKSWYIQQYTNHFFHCERFDSHFLNEWLPFSENYKFGVAEINLDYFADLID